MTKQAFEQLEQRKDGETAADREESRAQLELHRQNFIRSSVNTEGYSVSYRGLRIGSGISAIRLDKKPPL